MTKSELRESWDRVLSIIGGQIEKFRVETWFAPLTPLKIDEKEGKLILSTYNDKNVVSSIISNNYSAVLNDAILMVFGKPLLPVIVSKEEEKEDVSPTYTDDMFLNPEYNFETFIVGNNNRLAHAASLAVADGYTKNYNPLFLFGGSGLGKTHLMHAIGQYVMKNRPKKKVLYVSSEKFTNELVKAIIERKGEQFRNKYRTVDLLLFDDVQFIGGKESTEEELFHTFDTLYGAGKQIVFTSDRAPKDLGNIPDRLKSRFASGMPVDIQPPDYETRMAILMRRAEMNNIPLTEEISGVLDVIARNIQSNIRELEGAFSRVVAHSVLTNESITKEFTKSVLNEIFNTKSKEITPALIKKAVADYYGITVSDLESPNRSRNIAFPRQIAIYLIRENTALSLPKIGEQFGKRDHSTVSHSYNIISSDIKKDKNLRETIENIERKMTD